MRSQPSSTLHRPSSKPPWRCMSCQNDVCTWTAAYPMAIMAPGHVVLRLIMEKQYVVHWTLKTWPGRLVLRFWRPQNLNLELESRITPRVDLFAFHHGLCTPLPSHGPKRNVTPTIISRGSRTFGARCLTFSLSAAWETLPPEARPTSSPSYSGSRVPPRCPRGLPRDARPDRPVRPRHRCRCASSSGR